MNPTNEQIKEVWEWCDIVLQDETRYGEHSFRIVFPDKRVLHEYNLIDTLDLNNLFMYAVPKLKGRTLIIFRYNELNAYNSNLQLEFFEEVTNGIGTPVYKEHRIDNEKDPALALFWAIYEVIKE